MKRYPRTVAFATVAAMIAHPAFAVFGVMWLTEGKIVTGLILLACAAFGVPSFIVCLRQFR